MNNEAQIYPKIKNKRRTVSRGSASDTTHHAITCGVSLQVFLQLEALSEQRRKSKLWRTCFMTVPKCIYGNNKPVLVFAVIIDMIETRTIFKKMRLKLCKNLRTTSLGQNLLVLIKKIVCKFNLLNLPPNSPIE